MFENSNADLNTQPFLSLEQVVFAFNCDPNDILDTFEENSLSLGFQLIEKELTYAMAISQPKKNQTFMSMINCLSWWHVEGVTAIKLTLSKHTLRGTFKQNCIAEVKGLAGCPSQIKQFLTAFKDKITRKGYSLPSPKILMDENQNDSINLLQNQNPYYLEVCSHHMISKLILSEQHTLTQSLNKMVSDFKQSFKNVGESVGLLPLPMKNAMSIATDLGEQLSALMSELKYPKQIQTFSKISVEQIVFSRLEDHLSSIYRCKHIQSEADFQKKRKRIFQTYTLREILTEVCLHPKYWSLNEKKLDEILPSAQVKQEIHFSVVCRELEKIVFTASPREKIKYCQLAYTQLKTHFLDFSQQKYELSSMQDIIPVLIIIVLLLEVVDLRSEFDLMIDYITFESREMEAEKRLLINFSESYNYIARDWKLAH